MEATENPFGPIVMAHLKALTTPKASTERFDWKLSIIKRLFKMGYSKEDIWNLYRFIDWIMVLPDELNRKLHNEIIKYEEGKKMPHITTAEKIGMEKGIQQGILQASRGTLIEVLEVRFETLSQPFRNRLKEINDPDLLKSLHKKALHARSLEEFRDGVETPLA